MGKFTSGLIAGGAIGAIGLAVALSDKRTRKRMLRDGKRVMNRMHMQASSGGKPMAKKGKPKSQPNVDNANAATVDAGAVANAPRGKKPKKVYE